MLIKSNGIPQKYKVFASCVGPLALFVSFIKFGSMSEFRYLLNNKDIEKKEINRFLVEDYKMRMGQFPVIESKEEVVEEETEEEEE